MNTDSNTLPIPVRSENMVAGCGTYFRTSDVTPYIDGDTLVVPDGRGARRSWGCVNVRSEVVALSPDVVRVEVTGWHKHSRRCHGPTGGTFYFVNEAGTWVRRTVAHRRVKAVLAN